MKEILTLTQVNTGKIAGIDNLSVAIHTYLVQEMMDGTMAARPERPPQSGWEEMAEGGKFITEDGVHTATSFEELIGKITKDPRYRVNRPEDIDEIRQKFDDFNDKFGEGSDTAAFEDPEEPVTGDEWKDSDGT